MMAARITLDKCGQNRHLQGLAAGTYSIEYTDSTHLQPTEWVALAAVEVRTSAIPLGDSSAEQFYTLKKQIGDLPKKAAGAQKNGEKPDVGSDDHRQLRVIEDTLSLALGRVGLISPEVPPELLAQLLLLDEQDGVVIVPDTNALHNGAVHWLLRVLHRPSVWLMPVVASLTTIQQRDATVKGLVNKFKITNLGQALRSRGLVNGALGLLERNKGRCQVVEIDPSLLRYQKVASGSGSDPDQSDVLEDRLIIEAIHGVLRSMRSRTARRVVTSDVNLARVLAAEGIETLFVPTITLGDQPVDCLRYDAFARSFAGAPLRAVMWELAHAFGTVRLVQGNVELAKLECYWPGKTPAEWSSETLLCTFTAPASERPANESAVDPQGDSVRAAPEQLTEPAADANGKEPKGRGAETGLPDNQAANTQAVDRLEEDSSFKAGSSPPQSKSPSPVKGGRSGGATKRGGSAPPQSLDEPQILPVVKDLLGAQAPAQPSSSRGLAPINAALPRAALPQMFRLLGIARRLNNGTPEQIVAEMHADAISVERARRPLEILRRVNLLTQVGNQFIPTPDSDLVDKALRLGDLDSLSSILEKFDPYQKFSRALSAAGRIHRTDVARIVRELIGPTGVEESERLPRFHILLGQAWTDGEWIVDGARRPTDRDATDAFKEAFSAVESVGIAKVQQLLLRYCELTKMTPWAAKLQMERFVAEKLLPEYSFQPAAGAKPITRDEVLTGTLDRVLTEPVIIDRIFLGERPVFTVEGPSR